MPDFTPNNCPQCGSPIPAQAPEGLCPRCVAALNLQGETVFSTAAGAIAETAPSPSDLAPHFPQLEVIEYLGRGGMGVVYKARQRTLNRLVALKLLAPERVADGKFAARFAEEAKALAALNHPNIVTIYDFGQAGGFYYLLMEFVDGVNLRQAMKAGRFTPEQALSIVPPVCEGLQYAHDHGVVHRDIKPENLLLDRNGRVKIADFGIAKMLDADPGGVGTMESQPAGTPQYMAPEQRTSPGLTGPRADIYSLGVVLYEMLTGETPGSSLQPPSRRVQVDVRIDEIVLRALETKPELRYATAADFRATVEGMSAQGVPSSAFQPGKMGRELGLSVVAALAVIYFFAGLTFGALLLDSLRSNSGSTHLLVALVSLLVAVPLASKSAFRLRKRAQAGNPIDAQQAWAWLKLSAAVALFASVPAIFLGTMFAVGIFTDQDGWHPAPAEAVMVPLIMLGAVALPLSGWVLWRAAKTVVPARESFTGFARLFRALLVVLGVLITFFAFAVVIYVFQARSAPTVQVAVLESDVRDNALFVVVKAEPHAGQAAVWFGFEGPSIEEAVVTAGAALAASQKAGFLHPGVPASVSPPQVLGGRLQWRMMFLFPSETMAKKAQNGFRPMGPLNVAADRNHAGTLFEFHGSNGELYRASCFVSTPERSAAEYRRMAQWSERPDDTNLKPTIESADGKNPNSAHSQSSPISSVRREFSLRHRLASEMRDDLQPMIGKNAEAVPSPDNQRLVVQGPDALVTRVATFVTVTDWPESLKNVATGDYMNDSVLRTARCFFHACATEESPTAISRLLSIHILALLKGEGKTEKLENYLLGGVPDAEWEQSLRADWPGKDEAIRKFVNSWNRFALKRVVEKPGIAMGFGVKHFCSVSFDGAPKEFYEITIEPSRARRSGQEVTPFYFSSMPPWWEPSEADARKRDSLR